MAHIETLPSCATTPSMATRLPSFCATHAPLPPPCTVTWCAGKYAEGRFVYEGDFDEDAVTGSGKFSYPSGASYDGQWVGGLYSGKGRYAWPDGRSYEVRWQDTLVAGGHAWMDGRGKERSIQHTLMGGNVRGAGVLVP